MVPIHPTVYRFLKALQQGFNIYYPEKKRKFSLAILKLSKIQKSALIYESKNKSVNYLALLTLKANNLKINF